MCSATQRFIGAQLAEFRIVLHSGLLRRFQELGEASHVLLPSFSILCKLQRLRLPFRQVLKFANPLNDIRKSALELSPGGCQKMLPGLKYLSNLDSHRSFPRLCLPGF
jgi:hypothetical protein